MEMFLRGDCADGQAIYSISTEVFISIVSKEYGLCYITVHRLSNFTLNDQKTYHHNVILRLASPAFNPSI